MSTKFTENGAEAAGTIVWQTLTRSLHMLLAVAGVVLAAGSLFPISGWLSGLISVVTLAFFFLIASARWRLGTLPKVLIVPGLTSAAGMSLTAGGPAPRLALLAWVFICVFWVERSRGGKCRGRGGEVMVLGLASLGYAGFLILHSWGSNLWFVVDRVRACAPVSSVLAPVTPAHLMGMWSLGLLSVSLLIVLAGKYLMAPFLASMRERPAAVFLAMLLVCTMALIVCPTVGGHTLGRRATCGRRPPASAVGHLSAALYSPGLLDWEVPSPERLGLVRSGMFGLFRRSLERYVSTRGGAVIETDSLTPEVLSRVGLMVFINPARGVTRPERGALSKFVASGGSLLVLGDHTDIGGSRAPLNEVLLCTSIRFNFDSAICLRKGWKRCLTVREHPVTRGLIDETDAQIGIGASLEIGPPAIPLVTGRYAFSDVGNYDNGGQGAYMGNCRQDRDEPLCEAVLVAGEEVGNGRVLVFGDTSPFQNGAHFLSQRFVANAIHWLCGEEVELGHDIAPEIRPFDALAALDFSLNPNVARSLFTPNSLGGLANSFYRAGITPVPVYDARDWPASDVADYVVLVAPTRRLGREEILRLKCYMRSGGRLILSKGYATPEPCAVLLADLGLAIEPVPLGNGEASGHFRHKDAWGITYCGPSAALVNRGAPTQVDTLLHAQAFGYPTAVTVPVGAGSFTLISDGRFLLDGNLEGEITAIPKNVAFLARLIYDLRKGKRDLAPNDHVLARRCSH